METVQNKNQKTLDKTSRQLQALSGAVCVQYRRCGKASCRCVTGEKHGPYYYRCLRFGGKLRMEYIKADDVEAVKAACKSYQDNQRGLRQALQQSQSEWRRLKAALREYGM